MQVNRRSNKKSFAINFFQFCHLKAQQRYPLQEEVKISKRELTSLADSLHDLLKTFHHAPKFIHIPLPKPNVEIGSTRSTDNLFVHYYKDIIEHPKRQIHLSFSFRRNNSCVFSIKKFELHGKEFVLTKIVNFNRLEIHHL